MVTDGLQCKFQNAFGYKIDKDLVRRVLNNHYKNNPNSSGPSWLTFIGHMKDSLWSIDLFRESGINTFKNTLGDSGYGSIYTAYYWFCNAQR